MKISLHGIVFGMLIFLTACGREPEKFGEADFDQVRTEIKQIYSEALDSKEYTLEGNLISVCPAGCWFDIADNTGKIHVNLAPAGIAIPQYNGKKAVVKGKTVIRDGKISFQGKGVIFP